MEEKEYESFWEFLVRTPTNFVTTLVWVLLSILMIAGGISSRSVTSDTFVLIWCTFFVGIAVGSVIRVYLIYKKVR